MSQTLSDFLLTGKANFADFTKSVLEMIVKMMTQMAILKAMESAFGGTGFGSFLGLKGHASGGYTGDGNKYDIVVVMFIRVNLYLPRKLLAALA